MAAISRESGVQTGMSVTTDGEAAKTRSNRLGLTLIYKGPACPDSRLALSDWTIDTAVGSSNSAYRSYLLTSKTAISG